jgi:hypothetical protein
MYHVSMKNWTHSMHMPKRHDMAMGLTHLFHDDRFWAMVGAAVLFAVLLGLAIIASKEGGPAPDFAPSRPFFPY